jgi:hypothetical protein
MASFEIFFDVVVARSHVYPNKIRYVFLVRHSLQGIFQHCCKIIILGVGNQSTLSPGDLIYRVIYISTGLRAVLRVSSTVEFE